MIKTEHSTWSPEWDPSWHEIFRDFGYAAYQAQLLEQCLVQLLLLGDHEKWIKIPNKKDLDLETLLSGKTMGQLVCIFEKGENSDNLIELLKDARDARNHLSHGFFAWQGKNLIDPEKHGAALEELQDLRFRIGKTRMVMEQNLEQALERVSGFTKEDLLELFENAFHPEGSDDSIS